MYLTNLSFATYMHIMRALLEYNHNRIADPKVKEEYDKCIAEVASDLSYARSREEDAKKEEEAKSNASPE